MRTIPKAAVSWWKNSRFEIGAGNGLRQFGKFRNSIEWDWTVAASRILRKKCDTNPKLAPKTRTRTNSFRYENHFKWKRGWADQIQYAARKKWNLFIIFGNRFFLSLAKKSIENCELFIMLHYFSTMLNFVWINETRKKNEGRKRSALTLFRTSCAEQLNDCVLIALFFLVFSNRKKNRNHLNKRYFGVNKWGMSTKISDFSVRFFWCIRKWWA